MFLSLLNEILTQFSPSTESVIKVLQVDIWWPSKINVGGEFDKEDWQELPITKMKGLRNLKALAIRRQLNDGWLTMYISENGYLVKTSIQSYYSLLLSLFTDSRFKWLAQSSK